MKIKEENRLGQATSAYLLSARHQPVDWHEWGGEAFAKAQREDKPVLLDIGAVWCHWCHVMDRESYENAETAALINEHFVAVKVDRDERPDVDTRYQAAVAAISGQGGWPLTAFLTPEGDPFFGGTYFPPGDRYGRPGFGRVLRSMAEAYLHRRTEVKETAASVLTAIEQNENFSDRGGELGEALLETMINAMLAQWDRRNGGFGSEPKFPHPAALDLLLHAAAGRGPVAERAREAVELTLTRMAAGGIHDQLAGGFHRYSVDERWIVPHFEKMAYDNSELLRVYTHAFQSFANPGFARVARGTVRWMDEWMSDRQRGGFYGSQDADALPDDDGDFFTWTRAEAAAVLTPEEFEVAAAHYNLRAVGDMHHNPAKNVLHIGADVASIAAQSGRSEETVGALLAAGRNKLYAARLARPSPFVDTAVYVGWNGLCISAYLAAGRALALPEAVAFGLKSLDRVLGVTWARMTGMSRVVDSREADAARDAVPAVLEDFVFLGMAALDAWEATGELPYFTAAEEIAQTLLTAFYDGVEGGFFDTSQDSGAQIGALRTRRKPLQDAPTPAGNPAASSLMLRLHALTDKADYRQKAEETLATFAGVAAHLGLYGASFGQALCRLLSPAVQVCVIGTDALADDLAATATARFALNKSVVRLRAEQLGSLPPALAATLPYLPGLERGSVAVVCTGLSCRPPVTSTQALAEQLGML